MGFSFRSEERGDADRGRQEARGEVKRGHGRQDSARHLVARPCGARAGGSAGAGAGASLGSRLSDHGRTTAVRKNYPKRDCRAGGSSVQGGKSCRRHFWTVVWLSEDTLLTSAGTVTEARTVNHLQLLAGIFLWRESAGCLIQCGRDTPTFGVATVVLKEYHPVNGGNSS